MSVLMSADEQPAPRDRDRAAVLERDGVRGQAPREDRDDREADGEVAEPTHGAEELLRVAQLVEELFVLRRVEAGRLTRAHTTSQGSPTFSGGYYVHSRVDMSTGGRIGSRRADARRAAGRGRGGRDRHGRRRVHRHAGPAHGKAAPRGVLLRGDGGRAPGRGLQLPARARHGDGPDSRATRSRAGSVATATSR